MNIYRSFSLKVLSFFIIILCAADVQAQRADWQRQEVNWQLNSVTKVKAVYYPKELKNKLFKKDKLTSIQREKIPKKFILENIPQSPQNGTFANIIEGPPLDGFVPWLTVSVTDKRKDVAELEAVISSTIGNFLTANPQGNFGIGILDTGASSHVISYDSATLTGIYASDLVTTNTIDITGVTGPVNVFVSEPLGLFFDGLAAIDPCTLLINPSNLLGEYNVAVSMAPSYEPDVPTAIGTPFAVYYTAVIDNANQISINRNSTEYSGPAVRFYDNYDPAIPEYSISIPLELRPLGGVNVQYIPTIDPLDPFNLEPQSPSTIVGNLSQSVFFVHSVDIYEGINSALDKNRFMFDTGAQVSLIGSRIASRLHFNPDYPEFLVEISGINGQTIKVPGFTIDRIVIPAIGDWFIATDVPMILLDVFSPEGGTLDGIIGMNLFTKFNMVLRGGGLFLQEDPLLEIEPLVRIVADIAPEGGDGVVDYLDLQAFVQAWLSEGSMPPSPNWNPEADLAPTPVPDNVINFLDFAVFAQHWLEQLNP